MLNSKIIERELDRIAKKHGALTPHIVLQESIPKNAVLHHHFTWDNTKAAIAYREWQARQIIAVVTFQHPEMNTPVRMFQNVTLERPGEDGTPEAYRVYLRTTAILANPEMRNQLLDRAHREASEWTLRYKSLIELAEIITVMKRAIPGLKQKLSNARK
jgi:hypothetical protein